MHGATSNENAVVGIQIGHVFEASENLKSFPKRPPEEQLSAKPLEANLFPTPLQAPIRLATGGTKLSEPTMDMAWTRCPLERRRAAASVRKAGKPPAYRLLGIRYLSPNT